MQMPNQPDPSQMPGQPAPDNGGDMANKIRMAALSALSPPEVQLLSQTVTPMFIQIMAKLFGDQAVMLLQPLVGLGQATSSPGLMENPNALNAFNANAQGNGNPNYQPEMGMNMPEGGMEDQSDQGPEGGAQDTGECPMCGGQDPNCPACGDNWQYPTPVNFGRPR